MRRFSFALLALFACGSSADLSGSGDPSGASGPGEQDPGSVVSTKLSAAQQAELDAINAQLAEVKNLDAAGFEKKYAVGWATSLGYDPLTAKSLDVIDASSALKLDDDEKAKLSSNGFVISERKRYPSFIYGYQTIYDADLPVYVSADSILYAVHRSYDRILAGEEENVLAPALGKMLASMRNASKTGALSGFSAQAKTDVDFYLAVAHGLLTGGVDATVPGVADIVQKVMAAEGQKRVTLFGVSREEDFSQFKPRGHYTSTPTLTKYFRAMMWLGRIDLRILETKEDSSQVFRRRQLDAAYALRATMDATALSNWKTVEDTIAAFVGEADNMTLPELDGLLADLGLASAQDLGKKTDAEIAQAIVNGAYGTQRISSHIMKGGLPGSGQTMPLSSTFLLLGQRYVVDSHVFSNVVYDRVNHEPLRMMPNPLDVGFAALKNDQAGLLLLSEIDEYKYAPDLASMRIVVEAHPQEFWDANLYNLWLGAVRGLSEKNTPGLPVIANTEAWGRRVLNTQLASWAELRHDTILYAKQSYTAVPECEYPDAYVDPYPEVYARLAAFAARGAALPISERARGYFTNLGTIAGRLETMAKEQRTGAPHSAENMAFINQLNFSQGCGSPTFDGWYAQLFFDTDDALEAKPTIADVHTQPADEAGGMVGGVLHVGTGSARAMVVTVDSCNGPRAYVGLASSYFEETTENYKRLTDEEWTAKIRVITPADVPWMTPIVVR